MKYDRCKMLSTGGWWPQKSYKLHLMHRPEIGLMRLKVWEGGKLLTDSGNIIDNGPDALRGGRLGVFCDSQEKIRWASLKYRYQLKILASSITLW